MLRIVLAAAACLTLAAAPPSLTGARKQFQPVALTFTGPQTAEDATPNPFTHYSLDVTFTHSSGAVRKVAGFFAADGNAAESSATAGDKWRAVFFPDLAGEWKWKASFTAGGTPQAPDGESGSLRIASAPGRGILQYDGSHYLRFSGNGKRFLKGGADSPENFLAFDEFDGTFDADADSGSYKKVGPFIHNYAPHLQDWKSGDPTWKNGKGKSIIGALNYLAASGVNSVYFLTYNIDGGDGRDTWMWTSQHVRDRYDVSKLDQWEIVFSHMDKLGIMLHVITQETENDRALGGGPGLNPVRKLYLRELAARFAHHPALIWNLGEENNTPDADRKAIAAYIRSLDPYRHPITVHTHNKKALTFYNGILGDPNFEATSIQGEMKEYYREAVELRRLSSAAGRKWAIFGDEQAPANKGVMPDADDPTHDEPRIEALWGNLMGGGSGVEWYFGSSYAHMDINLEDFRSRDNLWRQTKIALDFFHQHLPFWEMESVDGKVTGASARVLAKGDQLIAIQLPQGGEASVNLSAGNYTASWFNPRSGGPLQKATPLNVKSQSTISLGSPPAEPSKDWVVLLRRK